MELREELQLYIQHKDLTKFIKKKILNDEYKIPSNSLITRLSRYNNQWLQYARYSLMAGGVYLLIDLIFFNNSKENNLETPPGFPHDS